MPPSSIETNQGGAARIPGPARSATVLANLAGQSLWLLTGLVVLVGGGELLVRGAAALALRLRIPPLIVGLTVVAFGTSAPELFVTVEACRKGSTEIAVGNVVGSNICNILLILGLSGMAAPLLIDRETQMRQLPIMVVATLAFLAMVWDGAITQLEGGLLCGGLVAYIVLSLMLARSARKASLAEGDEVVATRFGPPIHLAMIAGGLVCLVIGADLMVDAAVQIAKEIGVNQVVIGLTIVAVGTSLPELATSITAALMKQREISVGNVVGSNIFNLLGVLGIAAVVSPVEIPIPSVSFEVDMPFLIGSTLLSIPFLFFRNQLSRLEGLTLFLWYVAFVSLLVGKARFPEVESITLAAIPYVLTPLTLIVLVKEVILHRRDLKLARAEEELTENGKPTL